MPDTTIPPDLINPTDTVEFGCMKVRSEEGPDPGIVQITYDHDKQEVNIKVAMVADIQVSYEFISGEEANPALVAEAVMERLKFEIMADLPVLLQQRMAEAATLLTHEGTKQ